MPCSAVYRMFIFQCIGYVYITERSRPFAALPSSRHYCRCYSA